MNPEALMPAAAELAELAGGVAHRHFRAGVRVETKRDGSPVTVADREAEQAAREWVERRFPRDGIIGEEFGRARPEARRRWVIDPVDGTKTFVRGVPLWGTLVAVVEGDEILAGAAFFPALGELLAAAPGAGAWWNGARCHVSPVTELAQATAVTTDEEFRAAPERRADWERLAGRVALTRSWGDCYGYLLVATGRAELMTDARLAEWDAAPFLVAVREAGGVFTDWTGRVTAFGAGAIATNAGIARQARELLDVPAGVARGAGHA